MIGKFGQRDRCKVAHGNLVLVRVLNDLSAEVGALDGAEVLLVRLSIACVFVKHIWGSSLDLRVNDLLPKPLSFD